MCNRVGASMAPVALNLSFLVKVAIWEMKDFEQKN